MYKNQNIAFNEIGVRNGILQEHYLKEYLIECSQHHILYSQWLLYKKYIDQNQFNKISQHAKQCRNLQVNGNSLTMATDTPNVVAQNNTQVSHSTFQLLKFPKNPEYIGRYKIISVLGQGGMGKVYKVFDPNMQVEIALKLNAVGEVTSEMAKRFQREAQTMAKLNHPGIVKSYDIGNYEGRMFFTMDLVCGVSLKELLQKNPLTIKQSMQIVVQICEIMDYAHKQGVIHRDLKPANIMIDNGKPIIMDFGLAKVEETSEQLSKTGVMMGTLRYMAPEQVEGLHSATTAQSDQYSIGAILYELLARQPIFSVKSHLSLLNYILNKQPVPLCEINSKIPKELEEVCKKALSKQKNYRYQSCRTMANDLQKLQKLQNKRPKTSSNITRRTRAKSLERKRKKTNNSVMVVNAIFVLFMGFLLALTIGIYSSQSNDNIAKTPESELVAEKSKPVVEKSKPVAEKPKPVAEKRKPAVKIKSVKSLDWDRAFVGVEIVNCDLVDKKTGTVIKKSISSQKDYLPINNFEYHFSMNVNTQKKYDPCILGLRHLSAHHSGKDYAPINIYVNDLLAVEDFNPGPASSHCDEFDITAYMKQGPNTISICLSKKGYCVYWLYEMGLFRGN
ncbi:serine/threonine protein kinase [Candidatus Uabimicrobium sp. HlEnr_7]|uniref:serine/threonine protein kinase n=1 Tax=Candidatus Uabimicrobium helgolandensis TaxID=3095367 RepID=UPI0035583DD1